MRSTDSPKADPELNGSEHGVGVEVGDGVGVSLAVDVAVAVPV